MMPWFIDAIDARGGFAIATQRQGNDLLTDRYCDRGPSVFISPPAFAPEYLASRSTGLALARSRGQPGLFDGKEEIPFDRLAAVGEFVRRSYVRGTAGDGPGENGGSSPPAPAPAPEGGEPPAPEGGERRESPEGLRGIESGAESAGRVDPVTAALVMARRNLTRSRKLAFGESQPGEKLPEPADPMIATDVRRRRLARGALHVLRELILRQPKRSAEGFGWVTTLSRFIAVVTRMALWRQMRDEFLGSSAEAWIFGPHYHPYNRADNVLYEWFTDSVRYWPELFLLTIHQTTDAFDDVASFPVPPSFVMFQQDGQNLQALLSAAVATPSQLLKDPALVQQRAELTLFGAACLNLGGEYSPAHWIWDDHTNNEFADHIARRAQTWLGNNIPKFIYATRVEDLISKASAIPA